MADTVAGLGGADRSGVSASIIAPGHAIEIRGVREKLATFGALSMPGVLSAVEGARAGVWGRKGHARRWLFESGEAYGRYKAAHARKDWRECDRLLLDGLARDGAKYCKILDAEETARAFSAWLCGTALASDHVYRWIDPLEIGSCMTGVFESRIEADGARRGFKALTVNPGLRFGGRKIQMRVPMSDAMRRNVRCVQYTALPRDMEEKDERVDDPKEAEHASEAEVRVPDGTPIPPETDFVVLPGAEIGRDNAEALGARHRIRWLGG